jgi:hypothetical protein
MRKDCRQRRVMFTCMYLSDMHMAQMIKHKRGKCKGRSCWLCAVTAPPDAVRLSGPEVSERLQAGFGESYDYRVTEMFLL